MQALGSAPIPAPLDPRTVPSLPITTDALTHDFAIGIMTHAHGSGVPYALSLPRAGHLSQCPPPLFAPLAFSFFFDTLSYLLRLPLLDDYYEHLQNRPSARSDAHQP